MKTVGQQLQAGRLAKNWTPELAARETRIRLERLHDLEVDRYSNFSSPAYARGFVRTYARSLGLDEYRILRQLDEDLPEDNQAALVHDSGSISYVPEPARPAGTGVRLTPGVMIVLGLGGALLAFAGFVLFQSYRAGILPGFGRESEHATASTLAVIPSDTPARAQPTAGSAPLVEVTPSTPHAAPIDTPAVVAPVVAPVATDPTQNPASAPAAPTAPLVPISNPSGVPPRAMPVDLTQLNSAPPASNPVATARVAAETTPAPSVAPTATTTPVLSPATGTDPDLAHARRAALVDPSELNGATPSTTQVAASSAPATAPVPGNRLILTATSDSFVQVTSLDPTAPGQVLFASVMRRGQAIGFAGHKFSLNVGIPNAVSITLDGINYGPHSEQAEPESFDLESHLP